MMTQQQILDSENLTDEQKIVIKRTKLTPKPHPTRSKNMFKVQNMMDTVKEDQCKNIVKYFGMFKKEEGANLQKPCFVGKVDLMRTKQLSYLQHKKLLSEQQVTYQNQQIVDSPLIYEEFLNFNEFESRKDLYSDLFPEQINPTGMQIQQPPKFQLFNQESNDSCDAQLEKIKKRDKATCVLQRYQSYMKLQNHLARSEKNYNSAQNSNRYNSPQNLNRQNSQIHFITEIAERIPSKNLINLKQNNPYLVSIDNEQKLLQFEINKTKMDVKVKKKLGLIDHKDKKSFQIQELQSRALKLRIKINKNEIFNFEPPQKVKSFSGHVLVPRTPKIVESLESQTKIRSFTQIRSQTRIETQSRTEIPSRFKLDLDKKMLTVQSNCTTSPDGALKRAQQCFIQHYEDSFQEQVNSKFVSPDVRVNLPQTQAAKKRIMKFCDILAAVQKEQKLIRRSDQDQVNQYN